MPCSRRRLLRRGTHQRTNLHIAVRVIVAARELAAVSQLLDLHAGNNACDIAGFEDFRKCVMEVRKAGSLGRVARHGDDLDFRMLLCRLLGKGLMTVGVGENDLAALVDAVDDGIIAGFILRDTVFPDSVGALIQAKLTHGLLNPDNVCIGIAFVFIADQNKASLEICVGRATAAIIFSRHVIIVRRIGDGVVVAAIGAAAYKQAGNHRKDQ